MHRHFEGNCNGNSAFSAVPFVLLYFALVISWPLASFLKFLVVTFYGRVYPRSKGWHGWGAGNYWEIEGSSQLKHSGMPVWEREEVQSCKAGGSVKNILSVGLLTVGLDAGIAWMRILQLLFCDPWLQHTSRLCSANGRVHSLSSCLLSLVNLSHTYFLFWFIN